MKTLKMFVLALLFTVLISGCSNTGEESNKADGDLERNSTSNTEDNLQFSELSKEETIESEEVADETRKETSEKNMSRAENQMVIYSANLTIRVNSYEDTLKLIQKQLQSDNGYIVESNSYVSGEGDSLEGMITVRIPKDKFESFLQTIENGSAKIVDRSITGQDVTEEFVDLESRLKSKQVVEKRLLDFMAKAEKTEDLLKISSDLATIQDEIEQIKGRINYLNNKVELATVTIQVTEDKVNVPTLENKELNTWEKTKEQFMNSVNFLLHVSSALFIFIVGSLPVLLIIGVLLSIFLYLKRKRKKKVQEKPPTN